MQLMIDFIAQVILGAGSLVTMVLLYQHADELSDGNIGEE